MVAAHHTHQSNAVDVMPLGNHLRAYQQVDFTGVKPRQKPLEVIAAAYGVAIHTADARRGKYLRKPLLALLRAGAKIIHVFAIALRTARRNRSPKPAVVAFKPLTFARDVGLLRWRLVVGERNGAVLTLQLGSAGAAQYSEGVATPIEQYQRLLSAIERRLRLSD